MSSRDPNTLYAANWDFAAKAGPFAQAAKTAPRQAPALFIKLPMAADLERARSEIRSGLPAKPWGRIAVATAPSNPDVVYAVIESTHSALYRSSDGGKTWQEGDRSQMMVWRPFYFANLIVDPKDENKVYKAGGNSFSTDGGKSFS